MDLRPLSTVELWLGLRRPLRPYSAAVYAGAAVLCACAVRVRARDGGRDMEALLDLGLLVATLAPHLLVPLTHWGGVGGGDPRAWDEFQQQFRRTTGVRNRLPLRGHVRRSLLWLPVFSAVVPGVQAWVGGGVAWMAPGVLAQAVAYLGVATLSAQCEAVGRSATNLATELRRAVVGGDVAPYGALWVRLRALLSSTGRALAPRLLVQLASLSVSLALLLYQLVAGRALAAVQAVVVTAQLAIATEAAFGATQQVGDRFREVLNSLQSTVADVDLRWQLLELIQETRLREPSVGLAGFVTLDRPLLVSLCSVLTTYLVVLVQFRAGLQT